MIRTPTIMPVNLCNAVDAPPSDEICDDKDNDCDGRIDEQNPGGGQSCGTGLLTAADRAPHAVFDWPRLHTERSGHS